MTEWRTVIGHPAYEVSDSGQVRSLPREGTVGGLMKTQTNNMGYATVMLNGKRRLVHQLVLEAFHGLREDPDFVARHLDGDCTNNVSTNLVWGTRSQNTHDSVRHGTHSQARKTHCAQGHEFSPENTGYYNGGKRYCRVCRNAQQRRWYASRNKEH